LLHFSGRCGGKNIILLGLAVEICKQRGYGRQRRMHCSFWLAWLGDGLGLRAPGLRFISPYIQDIKLTPFTMPTFGIFDLDDSVGVKGEMGV
jgi:hypothetical protein